jgi:hypothetical protein
MKEKNYKIIKTFAILELVVFTISYVLSFFLLKAFLGESISHRLFAAFFVSAQVILIACIPLLILTIFISKMTNKINYFYC